MTKAVTTCLHNAWKAIASRGCSSRPMSLSHPRTSAPVSGALALMAIVGSTPALAQAPPAGMSPQVFQQIQAIGGEKAQRTDAQKKLDPALLYSARAANGQPQFPNAPGLSLPQLSAANVIGADGRALVDISTTDAAGLAGPIQSLGGTVISSFPAYNTVRASIPVTALETLAAVPSVKSVRQADQATTNRIIVPQPSTPDTRSDIVREQLARALSAQPNIGTGTVKSEAIVAHGADIVQNAGVTGAGNKICVLSDGVDSLAARQAAGELPAVQVLPGQAGSGDEGTAMLELIADMAPGASLGFATAFNGAASFATNIIDLRNVFGCNIIVDDVSYYAEAAFQEDIIANAVTTVVNSGAMYFSSAANSGHRSGFQSGTWEGDFVPSGAAPPPNLPTNLHDFDGANFTTLNARGSAISLKWSDPIGASANDYDVYVVDSTGTTILAASMAVQNGTQDPLEFILCTNVVCPAGARIYIDQYSGSARALRLDTHRGRLSIATNGSTYGHNGGVNTISVGAVSNAPQPVFGRKFRSSDTTTYYSSDGPRKLLLNPVPATTPITDGCFLYACGGGTLLPKVDIAAADCDTTTTPTFATFCGTSAAAPQAAAIAALVKSAFPALSNAQVLARMKGTAIDITVPGADADSGAGIVMADRAAARTAAASHDFNADGESDILWMDAAGNIAMWLMNGPTVIGANAFGNVGPTWKVVGQRDFNGDGKHDILWRDGVGNLAIWQMNGAAISSAQLISTVPLTWTVVGTPDLNGDHKSDILWRDGAGNLAVWFMDGPNLVSVQLISTITLAWTVIGTPDLNGDGYSDILWRDGAGNLAVWFMNGATIQSASVIGNVPLVWSVKGTGDFNGDGKSDILWLDSVGNIAIWLMDGAAVQSVALVGTLPTGSTWSVAQTGDYNGDGKSDILWRDGAGNVGMWLMNGTAGSGFLVANLPTSWVPQGLNAD